MEHHSTYGSEPVQQRMQTLNERNWGIREGRNVTLGKVEAFNKVLNQFERSGKVLRGIIVVSIGLTMFAYAPAQGITSQFDVMATSSFGKQCADWSGQHG